MSISLSGTFGSLSGVQMSATGLSPPPPPPPPVETYANYDVLLLTGEGANNSNNNIFLDSSTNNFAITRTGNTTQGSFGPFSTTAGYWSNYFDGSGDSITVPSNSAFDFGTGNYTVEFWYYKQITVNSNMFVMGSSVFFAVNASNTAYEIFLNSGSGTMVNASISLNVWNHFALVKSSNVVTVYHNGIAVGTINNSSINGYSNQTVQISGPFTNFFGYISNLRVVKGTAVYTSNFTPSTTPLTAISGTSLLTCQNNRFIDNSTNNFAITVNGNTSISSFGPLVAASAYDSTTMGGSMYFDGTGDRLSLPTGQTPLALGSEDFTVEAWIYRNATGTQSIFCGQADLNTAPASSYLFQLGTGSVSPSERSAVYIGGTGYTVTSPNPSVGRWGHCVWVRQGGTFSSFLNGTRVGTISLSGSVNAGSTIYPPTIGGFANENRQFNGYISNLRVVKGTAVYDPTQSTITIPSSPVTAISGTSLLLNGTNAAIYDSSIENNIETVGDAKISTTVSKWGSGSMYFDGTDDWLQMPRTALYDFGTGNCTMECWINLSNSSGTQAIFSSFPSSGTITGYTFGIEGTTGFLFMDSWISGTNQGIKANNNAISPNTWTHVAFTRSGEVNRLFVNGILCTTSTNNLTQALNSGGNIPKVGYQGYTGFLFPLTGYIQDLRITKGIARYTSNFTPPGQL